MINGVMSAGDLGAFVFYAIMVASSLATISEVLGELQRAAGATERLIEILQVESHITAPTEEVLSPDTLRPEVAFNQVVFHYPSRPTQAAVESLDLVAEEGKVLALVGPSGAGKTTLFELMQRFYDPESGQVTLAELISNVSIRSSFANRWPWFRSSLHYLAMTCSTTFDMATQPPLMKR
ncbi:ABC transporter ATP-binding protein [Vibrio maritimus]|uniref:ABC transporter ATP-binding protein n=1 Tax=Vibrio maritimus TaxID=990268 RepID=A0A090RP06_9VIBR|nr:ABC transporter ATP-binding protein [Vibrio maritimus]